MKDKMEDIKKAFAADMAGAQADGKAAADASNLPPLYIAIPKGRLTILNALLL